MSVLGQLTYMLALLAVGVGARRVGVLDERWTGRLTAAAFYVALPALIFSSTYDQRLGDLVSPALVAGYWVVIGLTVLLGWVVHSRKETDARRSVAIIQSYHGNLGFLGLPVVAATLGGEATAVASLILGLGTLTHIPITVLTLVRANGAAASVVGELRSVARNPILASLGAGILASVLSLSVPAVVDTALNGLSTLALPLALLSIGATLDTGVELSRLRDASSVVALKVVWMPAVAWLVFSALGVGPTALGASVLMLGAPTAVSTYVYATELGGDAAFASLNVFATTLVSLGTLSALAVLFG
ncbi:AEC family transporter [Halomicroarcula sp. GCM10025324]|uniref:AEC family transporter n=1 Tax=Haloarcula TaxID=2237 RepID=UPI0023E84B12|nr:AEC family transporter [Halomicroarcula sp. ZS-22-S1]